MSANAVKPANRWIQSPARLVLFLWLLLGEVNCFDDCYEGKWEPGEAKFKVDFYEVTLVESTFMYWSQIASESLTKSAESCHVF